MSKTGSDFPRASELKSEVFVHANPRVNREREISPGFHDEIGMSIIKSTKSLGSDSDTIEEASSIHKVRQPHGYLRGVPLSPNGNQAQAARADRFRKTRKNILMLENTTQTENRSFIKYLLNLINETITT